MEYDVERFDKYTVKGQDFYVDKLNAVEGLKIAFKVIAKLRQSNAESINDLLDKADEPDVEALIKMAYDRTFVEDKSLADPQWFEKYFNAHKNLLLVVGITSLATLVNPFLAD